MSARDREALDLTISPSDVYCLDDPKDDPGSQSEEIFDGEESKERC